MKLERVTEQNPKRITASRK